MPEKDYERDNHNEDARLAHLLGGAEEVAGHAAGAVHVVAAQSRGDQRGHNDRCRRHEERERSRRRQPHRYC